MKCNSYRKCNSKVCIFLCDKYSHNSYIHTLCSLRSFWILSVLSTILPILTTTLLCLSLHVLLDKSVRCHIAFASDLKTKNVLSRGTAQVMYIFLFLFFFLVFVYCSCKLLHPTIKAVRCE